MESIEDSNVIKVDSTKTLFRLYEEAIFKNAKAIERAEQVAKWLIIMVPSRIGIKSKSSAQGAYSAVNLLSLYHKLITLKYHTRLHTKNPLKYKLSPYLAGITHQQIRPLTIASVIEYVALFAELFAMKKGGNHGKNIAIWSVEIARAVVQLRLFHLNGYDIVTRHHFAEIPSSAVGTNPRQNSLSGSRVVQKPVYVSYGESKYWLNNGRNVKKVPILRSFAEILHILRPLLTLILIRRYGKKSWIVASLSLFIDLLSQGTHMSFWERLGPGARGELNRRKYALVLYMLWTPIYEAIFRNRVANWAYLKLGKVPIVRSIMGK